jgi:hypothetical protein
MIVIIRLRRADKIIPSLLSARLLCAASQTNDPLFPVATSPLAFGCRSEWLDDTLAGIESLVRQQSIGLHLGQQRVGALQIMGLAGGVRKKASGLPKASTKACILVLNPPLLRPIAWSAPSFLGAGTVPVSTHDDAVDHGVLVVSVGRLKIEHPLPRAVLGPTREAGVDLDRVAKALWQIAPRGARAVSVEHGCHEQPIVLGRHSNMTMVNRSSPDASPALALPDQDRSARRLSRLCQRSFARKYGHVATTVAPHRHCIGRNRRSETCG